MRRRTRNESWFYHHLNSTFPNSVGQTGGDARQVIYHLLWIPCMYIHIHDMYMHTGDKVPDAAFFKDDPPLWFSGRFHTWIHHRCVLYPVACDLYPVRVPVEEPWGFICGEKFIWIGKTCRPPPSPLHPPCLVPVKYRGCTEVSKVR